MSKRREAEETLKVLRQLEATRDANYEWTADELAQVAPYYNGSPRKFSISRYIQTFTQRTKELHPEPSRSVGRTNVREDELMELSAAVRTLFHAVCPHPVRYRDEEGEIDFTAFNEDLGIWLTTVSTTWIQMQDTKHDTICACCICFKMLATNYEDYFKPILTSEQYYEKRVSKNSIRRWASGLSSEGAKEGLESLVAIGKALLSGKDNSMISELTDVSSEVSDAEEDEPSIVTFIPESRKAEMRYDEQLELEQDDKKLSRRRESVRRPLDTIVEVSDNDGILTLAIPEINSMVHVRIPLGPYTNIGRNGICEYAKTFFAQLIKVKARLSRIEMLGRHARQRRVKQMHEAYQKTVAQLGPLLSGKQAVYTTRSRKRRRKIMLHGDEK